MRRMPAQVLSIIAGLLLGASLYLSAAQSDSAVDAQKTAISNAHTGAYVPAVTQDPLPESAMQDLADWCVAAKQQVQLTCKTAVLVATAPENDLVYQDATWRIVLTDDKGNETVYVKSFYYTNGQLTQ